MLPAFRPDSFKVDGKKVNVIVALNDKPLDNNGNYEGIINPEVFANSQAFSEIK